MTPYLRQTIVVALCLAAVLAAKLYLSRVHPPVRGDETKAASPIRVIDRHAEAGSVIVDDMTKF